jgi:D-alanyl-D-alanine carboxypeptidase
MLFSLCFEDVTISQAAELKVNAHAYVVMDANTGDILLNYCGSKKMYPASTAKLMTAIVVCRTGKLNKRITFRKSFRKQIKGDATGLNLVSGSSYTVRQYLHMLLIASDADSAVALAKGLFGSVKNMVAQMNRIAKQYGMVNCHFDNPIGLDIGNGYKNTYGTALEYAILTRNALRYPVIRAITGKKSYRVPKAKGKKSFVIHNTNDFLNKTSYNKKKYKIIGTKTGTTKAAGYALIVTAVNKKGKKVICAFYGNKSRKAMYTDIKHILNQVFSKT